MVAVSFLAGLVAAGLATGRLSLLPLELRPSQMGVAAAQTHVLVDSPSPSAVQRKGLKPDYDTLIKHAELLGRVTVSPPVLDRIAARTGLRPGEVGGTARTTVSAPDALLEPGSEERAAHISRSKLLYAVEAQARPTAPVIDIYTRAPSAAEAVRLADAAVPALREYLSSLAADQKVPETELVSLRQIGDARGGSVNAHASTAVAVLAFVVGFVLCGGLLLLLIRSLRRDRAPGAAPARPDPADGPEGEDDWPHTARLLPWMLAGFVAVIWLVPFNAIELDAKTPIDLTLDRLLLPIIAVAWIVAFTAGGRAAPRLQFTWIHAAIGLFVAFAFLSVVFDARYLSQTLELELAFKKLPLLVSFVSVFLIMATTLRRSEVPAFLNYTLVLALVCALGVIFEYKFKQNPFYDVANKILPGGFEVAEVDPAAVDGIGRRIVQGPGEGPLEAVAMLSLAVPIALVRLIQSHEWRWRIVYGLAAGLLVAGTFATYRKSAVLAPIAVVLTLAYFRRRELLKLAPIGMVLVVIVALLSPGPVQSTLDQFVRPDALAVPTVSDRASDYDAVRPDLWSHLAFGRGWGSYNHETYRILDSEILHRTVEMGLLGLAVFLLMILTVILSARKTIAARDPLSAPVALVGAAVAAAFLVLSTLFDVLSFPHPTYIFLYTAALVAVVIAPRARQVSAEPEAADPGDHERRVREASNGRRFSEHPRRGGARAPVHSVR